VASPHRWPAAADDVLVKPLAGPDAEGEAVFGKQRGRGRCLRHHGRMITDEGTGDAGSEPHALRAHSRRGKDRPGEAGVVLAVEPGVEVVADLDEVEAGLLSANGLTYHLLRRIGFCDQLVAELHVAPPGKGLQLRRKGDIRPLV
jgi:hypothetical protein